MKEVGNGQRFVWTIINENQPGNKRVYGDGTQWSMTYADYDQMLTDMDGYNYTWNGASSYDGRVKANDPTLYPVFYKAAHYRDELIAAGIALSGAGAGNWYLPSAGEYFLMLNTLGFYSEFSNQHTVGYIASGALDFGFTQVGGERLGVQWHMTSTQYATLTYIGSTPAKRYSAFTPLPYNGNCTFSTWYQNTDLRARAFIKY